MAIKVYPASLPAYLGHVMDERGNLYDDNTLCHILEPGEVVVRKEDIALTEEEQFELEYGAAIHYEAIIAALRKKLGVGE